jgi:nicotinate-nucleotide pyrophosphorylase (carboxylating)
MLDLNRLPLPELARVLVSDADLLQLREAMRREDLAERGDVTTDSIIAAQARAEADAVARQGGVLAGLSLVERMFPPTTVACKLVAVARDGEAINAGQIVASLRGGHRAIVTIERPVLNMLCWLSGIASATSQHVQAVRGTKVVICETRKTTPGLRAYEKYAVRCGGGTLHRLGLHDAALYKDNHLARLAADWTRVLADAIGVARSRGDLRFVQVEVDSLDQLRQVLAMPAGLVDMVLLDNMTCEQMKQAVELRDRAQPRVLLEASGGVTLATVAGIAATGVDRISIGAITHSAPWLDIGLDIRPHTP